MQIDSIYQKDLKLILFKQSGVFFYYIFAQAQNIIVNINWWQPGKLSLKYGENKLCVQQNLIYSTATFI